MGQDVFRRRQKHAAVLSPIRASVIKHKIETSDKLKHIDALCSIHLLFQAETWDRRAIGDVHKEAQPFIVIGLPSGDQEITRRSDGPKNDGH
eukprot:8150759-Pyramimonas_sp.AAC.1